MLGYKRTVKAIVKMKKRLTNKKKINLCMVKNIH